VFVVKANLFASSFQPSGRFA